MPQIQKNIALKAYNTFKIEAQAAAFVEINSSADLEILHPEGVFNASKILVMGAGSNMLFTQDYEGLVLKINIKGIEILKQTADYIHIQVGAGEIWNDFVRYCVENNFAGVENLTLIPGTVGAAPVQNIGAYGVELKDVFYQCEAFEMESGRLKTFDKAGCKFGYRESIFKNEAKGKYIITKVTFQLPKNPQLQTSYGAIETELKSLQIERPTIADISKVVAHIRVSKLPDPSTIGNAGSFFKNPIVPLTLANSLQQKFPDMVSYPINNKESKLAAGWLIEQCGWKGKVVNHTGTWKNQALVLVNHGGATGKEIFALAQEIIQSVKEKFGVILSPEVNIL